MFANISFAREWSLRVEYPDKTKKIFDLDNKKTQVPLKEGNCSVSGSGKVMNGHEIRHIRCGKGESAFYVTHMCKVESKEKFDVVVGYKKHMIMEMCGK